jgi:hypothetical protein
MRGKWLSHLKLLGFIILITGLFDKSCSIGSGSSSSSSAKSNSNNKEVLEIAFKPESERI